MSDGHVLSICDLAELPAGGHAPIRLFAYTVPDDGSEPVLELIAEHATGVDLADVMLADGTATSFDTCLTAAELARDDRVAAIGDELWRRIAPGAVGDALEPVAFTSRVHLDLQSPSLDRLPWELLRIGGRTPFTKFDARWSLGHPVSRVDAATARDHPIRIMVVVGNDPEDGLQSAGELRHIESAANAHPTEVLLKLLTHPTNADIEQTVRQFRPHVFHFIGHGAMVDGAPRLLIHQPRAERATLNAQRLNDIFSPAPPRLVVLNACFAGTSGNRASSLPRAFTDLGAVAVVAMTEEILNEAAVGFTQRFYKLMLDGAPIDAAVTESRRAIRSAMTAGVGGNLKRLETSWPLVRLTVQGSAEAAVAKTCTGPANRRWLTNDFIARWRERHAAWTAIDGTSTRLAVLSGKEESGRKELLNCLADSCARNGDIVLMVELDRERSGTWKDVVRAVASAAAKHPELESDQLVAIADSNGERSKVVSSLLTELESCSEDRRVLVAIDGLGTWSEDLVEDIIAEMCTPFCSAASDSTTRLAITLAETGSSVDFGLPRDVWEPVKVEDFREDEWERGIVLFIEGLTDDVAHRTTLAAACTGLVPVWRRSAKLLALSREHLKVLQGQA